MVIEIDGGIPSSIEAKDNDKIRDGFMRALGLKIIRFTNEEVRNSGEVVVEKLKNLFEKIILPRRQKGPIGGTVFQKN